jgi:triphosphoribosyl-dephospho-CoA synthase
MLFTPTTAVDMATTLAQYAVEALLEEVRLTPKPGLVDGQNSGSHHDLTLEMMERSAFSLEETFFEIAMASFGGVPSQRLRERLAAIGRYGEQVMLRTTGQVNTHKGAIWVLGLLTAGAALNWPPETAEHPAFADANVFAGILNSAGLIASFEDRYKPIATTNGDKVRSLYRVRSAREEAVAGFPTLGRVALPAWLAFEGAPETVRRLNVLLTLMSVVDDTCIIHRSTMEVGREVQQRAGGIIRKGGVGVPANAGDYAALDQFVTDHWVSPGGSADLLAATIFLQKVLQHYKIN